MHPADSSHLFPRLDTVVLRVRDFQAAAAWYQDRLGATVTFQDPSARLAVLSLAEGAPLTLWELTPGHPYPAPTTFPILATPDAAAARARLLAMDVAVGDLIEAPGVRYFEFFDPDGNRLEACQILAG